MLAARRTYLGRHHNVGEHPTPDVNALKLAFFIDPDKCDDKGVTAVIEGLTVS